MIKKFCVLEAGDELLGNVFDRGFSEEELAKEQVALVAAALCVPYQTLHEGADLLRFL